MKIRARNKEIQKSVRECEKEKLEDNKIRFTKMSDEKKISVAFVCLGNICRSPMAEAVFASVVKEKGYDDRFETIDSFGTSGWHVGEPPDHRSSSCCRSHGVPVKHSAQQIRGEDFKRFDYIIGMDSSNLNNLKRIQPKGNKSVVELFGNWRTDKSVAFEVQDPYYGGKDGFETNFKQLKHFSEVFLEREVDRK